jgi:hypothetical protein
VSAALSTPTRVLGHVLSTADDMRRTSAPASGFNTDDDSGKMVMSVEGRESVTGVFNKLVYPDVEIRRAGGQTSSADGEGEVASPSAE